MTVSIIGLGLIGGSLGLDLKSRGFAEKIIGVDVNRRHAQKALTLGLVDELGELDEAIESADLLILAVPVGVLAEMLPAVLDRINGATIVTDTGSTKRTICEVIRHHPKRKRFVAAHPIAGTENSGPSAAVRGLFNNKISILCDIGESDRDAAATVTRMYETVGMKVLRMQSELHDRHMAYVSHISHVVSFALASTVLEIEQSESLILDLASSGLDSTVRLAKSSPDMWTPILEQNAEAISRALESYLRHVTRFKHLIDKRDVSGIHEYLASGNEIRRVLDNIGRRGEP